MARARNIKPGFFQNEELAELPFECRLLFIGLWCLADRDGLLEDRPKRIKMGIFPADKVDVDHLLDLLVSAGFILRYESDGLQCINIISFKKHQNPHSKEAVSVLPKPDEHQVGTVQAPCEHQSSPVLAPCLPSISPVQAPCLSGASPADSLIPDSLIPETLSLHAPTERERSSAPAVSFDCSKGVFTEITDQQKSLWREAYSAITLDQEMAKAAAWLMANPKNRKSNYARFLTNWFARAQDAAPRHGGRSNALVAENFAGKDYGLGGAL